MILTGGFVLASHRLLPTSRTNHVKIGELHAETYLHNGSDVSTGRNNVPRGSSHWRGRATSIFSVTANSYRSLVGANTPRGADVPLVEGSACNDVCHNLSVLLDRDKTNKVHAQTSTYLLPESGLRASMRAVRCLTCKALGATDVHTVQGLANPPGSGRVTFQFVRTSQVVNVDSQRIRIILESLPAKRTALSPTFSAVAICVNVPW